MPVGLFHRSDCEDGNTMIARFATLAGVLVALVAASHTASAETPEALLKTLRSVGREGKGNVAASRAVRELSQADATILPTILRGFADSNPLAANWIRSAFETVAERELQKGGSLPRAELEKFLLNRKENPRARRLAFEWLVKVDPTVQARLVPGMLDDPSDELRREAVQQLTDQATVLKKDKKDKQAIALYRKALSGAVHDDQVKRIVEPLRQLGEKVDLQKQFGFLTSWQAVGPFDNKDKKGFDVAYPPEKKIDIKASYKGQLGKVAWTPVSTEQEYGIVDIAKSLMNYKGSAMYVTTNFQSDKARNVEIRLGTPNSWKLWVNGKLLFAREEYHRGMKIDQYRVDVALKPGRNVLLLKILQNEQTDNWAQRYQFQLRVCDGTGSAVLSQPTTTTSVLPSSSKSLVVKGSK